MHRSAGTERSTPSSSTSSAATRAAGARTNDPATRTLRCAVIGVGRMGRHHARKYTRIDGCHLVAVVDASEDRREAAADELGCQALANESDLLDLGIDCVTIATPTVHHLQCAKPLLEAGIACLIEKPLATTVEESQQLVAIAERHNAVLMVGHIERFNPVVRAMQRVEQMDVAASGGIVPRFIEVSRVSPMTFRSVDVSVVMDMMIHDLDVVLMLMGGLEPSEIHASGIAVLTEHEDIASARLVFDAPQGKCVANISSSRLAFKTERKTRITGENAYVSIDYGAKAGTIVKRTANEVQMDAVREALRSGTDLSDLNYHDLVAIEHLEIDDRDQLETEVAAFVEAVRSGNAPPIDARAGLAAVRTAQRIIDTIRADWNK
ncbi:MAG: Gfo/Idh/MocA family protein [Phycisphaerales bacterium]